MVEKRFKINTRESTHLSIGLEDFGEQDGTITLTGRLVDAGDLIQGSYYLVFSSRQKGKLQEHQREIIARPDEEGRYSADGFKPGHWEVSLHDHVRKQELNGFTEVIIPIYPPEPFIQDLVIPTGRIKGILVNAVDGSPIEETLYPLRFQILRKQSGSELARINQQGTRPLLEIQGLPAGDYQLFVQALPYENYQSEGFTVNEGQVTDLGRIRLNPAGVLILRVEGGGGHDLQGLEYGFPGREGLDCPVSMGYERDLSFSIPTPGPVRLILASKGFKSKEVELKIPSGTHYEWIEVLDPE